jgi:hypothetical protein
MYDASKLAEETDAKLSGLIKQVSHCCWPGQAHVVIDTGSTSIMVLVHGCKHGTRLLVLCRQRS